MKIIVQKFGGTSLKTEEERHCAALHVKDAVQEGYKVVVIVSAMGRQGDPYATDTLLQLIDTKRVNKREQDLLLSCGEVISAVVFSNVLARIGLKATAMTGPKAGFRTNDEYTNAKIIKMETESLLQTLEELDVIVVAGFQGLGHSGHVTTLGRGGSDTSATSLAVAIRAERVDIFTDVEGVMTADPRVVSSARTLDSVTYHEICNLAYQGAKVIHPRAVEIAMQANLPIQIRSTYSKKSGTMIANFSENNHGKTISDRVITSIAHLAPVSQMKVNAKEGEYHLQEIVFKAMAKENISVDFININPKGVIYTVNDDVTDLACDILYSLGLKPEVVRNCAKVSAVGAGMRGVPGVTAKIVAALSKENIQILQSADSHTTIWVLVKEEDMEKAVNALHDCFQLDAQ